MDTTKAQGSSAVPPRYLSALKQNRNQFENDEIIIFGDPAAVEPSSEVVNSFTKIQNGIIAYENDLLPSLEL